MPKIGVGGTGNIDSVQMDEQASAPSTPGAGKSAIFLKADGLYVIDDAGAVTGPLASPDLSAYVAKALFDAQTILAATSDDTPAALTVTEATIVGRQTGGNISAIGQVSAGERTAGTETALRGYSPADIASMAGTHGGGGGGGGLTYSAETLTTANLNATEEYFHDLTIAGLTADRDVNLPTPSAAGKRVKLRVLDGDDAYEAIVKADGTEITRLFIEGETLELMSYGTGAGDWKISDDGRIPCKCLLELTSADTTNSANTNTLPTWDSATINVGDLADLVNYRVNIRRAGTYRHSGIAQPNSNVTDQNYYASKVFLNGTASGTEVNFSIGTAAKTGVGVSGILSPKETVCAVGDYLDFYYQTVETNRGIGATRSWFMIEEV